MVIKPKGAIINIIKVLSMLGVLKQIYFDSLIRMTVVSSQALLLCVVKHPHLFSLLISKTNTTFVKTQWPRSMFTIRYCLIQKLELSDDSSHSVGYIHGWNKFKDTWFSFSPQLQLCYSPMRECFKYPVILLSYARFYWGIFS